MNQYKKIQLLWLIAYAFRVIEKYFYENTMKGLKDIDGSRSFYVLCRLIILIFIILLFH